MGTGPRARLTTAQAQGAWLRADGTRRGPSDLLSPKGRRQRLPFPPDDRARREPVACRRRAKLVARGMADPHGDEIAMRDPASSGGSQGAPEVAQALGNLQAAILEDLWRSGESTVRDVCDRLRVAGNDRAYTTVLTVMSRLFRRGLLSRRRIGRRDLYSAAVEPADLEAAITREAVDRLLAAHGEAALAAFAERVREGDPADLARLRAMLGEAES